MAERESIAVSGSDLEDKMLDVVSICRAFYDLAADNEPPPWLAVIYRRVVDLDAAVQVYMGDVHQLRLKTTNAGVQPAREAPGEADA